MALRIPLRFRRWFWRQVSHYPVVRQLRPRLMAMILSLVLPVCFICLTVSVVSIIQTSRLIATSGNNALALHLQNVQLRSEYEQAGFRDGFPGNLTRDLNSLCQMVESFGGKLYVTDDGQKAWMISAQTAASADAGFPALRRARYQFFWSAEDGSFQVLVTFPYNFALRYVPPWFWIGIALSLLSLAACPILYRRLKRDILDPMHTLDSALEGLKEDLSYRIPPQSGRDSDEFLRLFAAYNAMAGEVQTSHDKDVQMVEAEMENLRLQVNPHMLLNSYNMIFALAESRDYATIQDYALCLVDYFRYVLRRGQKMVTVRQELAFVDNFIRIQRIRFPGRFSYVYQTEDACLEALIPPLLIENFVENAVKYALEPNEPIEIVVSVHMEENDMKRKMLHIAVTDTGSGIRPEVLEKLKAREPYVDDAGNRHIGIWNCMRRVELFYGDEGAIHFASGADHGTQVYLIVPLIEEEVSAP